MRKKTSEHDKEKKGRKKKKWKKEKKDISFDGVSYRRQRKQIVIILLSMNTFCFLSFHWTAHQLLKKSSGQEIVQGWTKSSGKTPVIDKDRTADYETCLLTSINTAVNVTRIWKHFHRNELPTLKIGTRVKWLCHHLKNYHRKSKASVKTRKLKRSRIKRDTPLQHHFYHFFFFFYHRCMNCSVLIPRWMYLDGFVEAEKSRKSYRESNLINEIDKGIKFVIFKTSSKKALLIWMIHGSSFSKWNIVQCKIYFHNKSAIIKVWIKQPIWYNKIPCFQEF